MPSNRPVGGVLAIALFAAAVRGGTIDVPGDFPTIQQAIDAAADGDEVLVADGVYTGEGNWDIDFGGRLITVRSAHGPETCVIDCAEEPHRGFHFHNGETRAAVVQGFTVRDAYFYWNGCNGSAIRCDNSSPTIANCIIERNKIEGDCAAYGAGILSWGGSPAILGCRLIGNEAFGYGGSGGAGGIHCQGGNSIIAGCVIADNLGFPAGGVTLGSATALVVNCTFTGNNIGGMANMYSSRATVVNCAFSGNTGVGLYNQVNDRSTVTNCSFSGNSGPGLRVYVGRVRISNCIVWGNGTPQIHDQGLETVVTFSDVQGGFPGDGNIDADPLLGDDLRPASGSPCIDAGRNAAMAADTADLDGDGDTVELTPLDLDDGPRFADLAYAPNTGCGVPVIVDMGAYEHKGKAAPGAVYLGDLDGSGSVGLADTGVMNACIASRQCCEADLDLDGDVGASDGAILTGLLVGTAPIDVPPAALPSPAEMCQFANLVPSNGDGVFGYDVAVWGDTAIIGAPSYYAQVTGSARVFRIEQRSWEETQELLPPDGMPGDNFGWVVDMEGDRALVAAPDHVHFGALGSVYVFRFNGAEWEPEQELLDYAITTSTAFGRSAAIGGHVAVVGAFGDDTNGNQAGAAYVYRFDGLHWFLEQKLLAPPGDQSTAFGHSVAVAGDVVVIGAYGYGPQGAVHVYRFSGPQWVHEQKLQPFGPPVPLGSFGQSVSISGNVIVVGADISSLGAAYVYRLDPAGPPDQPWAGEEMLVASDFLAADNFGRSVAVDGDTVVVGARHADQAGYNAGAAYVFAWRDGTGWTEVRKLLPPPDPGGYFGESVALSGDVAVVGASGDQKCYIHVGVSGVDCNANGLSDGCDILDGASHDADANGIPDSCECAWDADGDFVVGVSDLLALLAAWGPGGPADLDGDGVVGTGDLLELLANWGPCPTFVDCNANGVFDVFDIAGSTSPDCNLNDVPDECEVSDGTADCNRNGLPDQCDLIAGTSPDCNQNGVPDGCDLAGLTSTDCDGNGVPDECDADCNRNGVPDACDLAGGKATDCNGNGVPDECEGDCNGNGVPDDCDLAAGSSLDCDANAVPDECDPDCNGNGVADACDIASGPSTDFDLNGVPDDCQPFPPNDYCYIDAPITDGQWLFNTTGATTDGWPTGCSGGDGLLVAADIWYLYTASCTGWLTLSTCNSAAFDTRIAVYAAAPCPPAPSGQALACSDNAAGCGETSQVQVVAIAGTAFLVRVGGTTGGGPGMLTISCQPF